MKIVLATSNRGKISEIKDILDFSSVEWVTVEDQPEWPEVVEDGQTFLENAPLKAGALSQFFGEPALADDSGLEVEALENRPGIKSARFAGPKATDEENITKLLDDLNKATLRGERSRVARFLSVVVLYWPGGRTISAVGQCQGTIAIAPRGTFGFGYDPIFIPNGYGRTMAELSPAEKNKLSHRGSALRELHQHFKNN